MAGVRGKRDMLKRKIWQQRKFEDGLMKKVDMGVGNQVETFKKDPSFS